MARAVNIDHFYLNLEMLAEICNHEYMNCGFVIPLKILYIWITNPDQQLFYFAKFRHEKIRFLHLPFLCR